MNETLVKYVFAKSIDRGGPGMVPDWPQADPALNRFYLVADVDARLRQREEELATATRALQAMQEVNDYDSTYQVELEQQLAASQARWAGPIPAPEEG